jgi:hypothetical protein
MGRHAGGRKVAIAFLARRWAPRSARGFGHRHQADLERSAASASCARPSEYAIENKRKSVTLVHKGNIMKFTEGAFRDWGYEVAKPRSSRADVTEDEVWAGSPREG